MMTTGERTEGWKYLFNSPKWHYFRNGRSLCRKWMNFGKDFEGDKPSPDNCKGCLHVREKELAAVATPAAGPEDRR